MHLASRLPCGHYIRMPPKSPQKAAHLVTGARGEDQAAAFLKKRGMSVVVRNWRTGHLELDIIARDGETLVFVEVKSRTDFPGSGFSPMDAFDKTKRERILKAATLYLDENRGWEHPCRFDLVCVIFMPDNTINLEHHENVLNFESPGRGSVGGRNTPWQPW